MTVCCHIPGWSEPLACLVVCEQPGCLAGASDEFIFAARLDNLMMSYLSLEVGVMEV